MDYNLIHVGIVIAIAVILLIIFWPRNDSFHRNLRPGIVKIILSVSVIIIILGFFLAGKKIIRNGVGELYTDYAEVVQTSPAGNGGDTLIVVVSLEEIRINDRSMSTDEAAQAISNAMIDGKKIRLVDDYASASTYNGLIELISDLGIERTGIEEVMTP